MASPTLQQIQQTTTTIPDYAKPYVEELLGSAQGLTDINQNPYMQYMGDRVAQFTPLQQQSYENAGLMRSAPQLQDASAMAGMAGLGALNTQYTFDPYQTQSITGGRQQSYPAQIPGTGGGLPSRAMGNQMDPGAAYRSTGMPMEDVAQGSSLSLAGAEEMSAYDPQQLQVMPQQGGFGGQQQGQTPQAPQNTLQQYMNPYMQNVVERQQQDAQRQAQIAGQAQQAQAARSGAFGGSGDYLMRGQAAGNLARQKGDIQAQGLNNAYTQAMSQFNTEQQQRQAAAQLNAQQQQFGAGLGLQGLQTANQAASNLANIGQTQYGQNMGILGMQNQFGGQQQQQVQNVLNNQYGDFLSAQNYPYKQLGFMSDMLRGLPLTQQSQAMYGQAPSMVSQVAGLGGAALTGAKLFGAKGGATGDLESRPAGLADLAIYQMG
jgi:hypothetical protein